VEDEQLCIGKRMGSTSLQNQKGRKSENEEKENREKAPAAPVGLAPPGGWIKVVREVCDSCHHK